MQQGTADVVDGKCILRPYRGFSDFGLVPFADAPLVTDSSISLQSDDCLNQNPDGKHPCELGPLKPHGVAEDHSATLGKEEEPYLFQQFHVASRPPFLWGSFCKQYNWPEDKRGRNLFENGKEYFGGSWRNENETWVFVKDIKTCKCYPKCAKCQERVPGTLRMRRVMTGPEGIRCLAEYGADESGCDYVLHGVSGGAIIYYDDPVLPSGQYQRCYVYATISGIRKRSP